MKKNNPQQVVSAKSGCKSPEVQDMLKNMNINTGNNRSKNKDVKFRANKRTNKPKK